MLPLRRGSHRASFPSRSIPIASDFTKGRPPLPPGDADPPYRFQGISEKEPGRVAGEPVQLPESPRLGEQNRKNANTGNFMFQTAFHGKGKTQFIEDCSEIAGRIQIIKTIVHVFFKPPLKRCEPIISRFQDITAGEVREKALGCLQ